MILISYFSNILYKYNINIDIIIKQINITNKNPYIRLVKVPDDSKITVFNKGNSKGSMASIPIGGHCAPNSTVGDNALWKKVQKIAKKNKASETINKATPMFKPFCTAKVWLPK